MLDINTINLYLIVAKEQHDGVSPSGKASDFDSDMRRFDPYHPNHENIQRIRLACRQGNQKTQGVNKLGICFFGFSKKNVFLLIIYNYDRSSRNRRKPVYGSKR